MVDDITEENKKAAGPSETLPRRDTSPPSAQGGGGEPPKGTVIQPRFSGTTGEFFRIWIVNIFLTIITFGIYGAWAKVRTRRYFYAHTKVAGHPFDYLANPVAILKGNLIIGGAAILYSSTNLIHPLLTPVVALTFAAFFPFLIYKSLRFYAHNSAYRNIRFRFHGGLKESYLVYLLIPLTIPFTLGLIFPYWSYRRKAYFYNNVALGSTATTFVGRVAPFYRIYGVATAAVILLAVGGGALLSNIGGAALGPLLKVLNENANGSSGFNATWMLIIGAVAFYLTVLLIMSLIKQYLFVRMTNYCWHHARLGKVLFQSTIRVRTLVWIRVTNILAIIFSLGLMVPWAKIRRTRYILDNLSLLAYCSLDEFTAATAVDESALGEAATDFFDFEIGL